MKENAVNTDSSGTMCVFNPRRIRRSAIHQNGADPP
jgi:hypothetical protein